MTLRKAYEDRLHALNESIVEMGHEAEKLIDQTITALKSGDHELAAKTIDQDDVVDLKQLQIEKECALLIAHQQPIARDLRFILSVVKIVTEIERIADQCCDICKYSIRIDDKGWSKEVNYQRHIERMAVAAKGMLRSALDSFITKDVETIKAICKADDKIDEGFWKVWNELTEEMKRDSGFIDNGMRYVMIIKYLERIADHITNIAEWTYFSLTGQYIIHEKVD